MTTITTKTSVADIIALAAESFKSGAFVENRALAGMTEQPVEKKDNPLVNAIRNGKLVEVRWSQLTPDEKRAAYCNMFEIYE